MDPLTVMHLNCLYKTPSNKKSYNIILYTCLNDKNNKSSMEIIFSINKIYYFPPSHSQLRFLTFQHIIGYRWIIYWLFLKHLLYIIAIFFSHLNLRTPCEKKSRFRWKIDSLWAMKRTGNKRILSPYFQIVQQNILQFL